MSSHSNVIDKQHKKWMLSAIIAQMLGMHGNLAFKNSLLLLYMLAMGFSQTLVIALLAVFGIGNIVRIPVAYFSDKFGKKRFGSMGNILGAIGFIIIATSAFATNSLTRKSLAFLGIFIFSCGDALFGAVWFPILRPIVPEKTRGTFFGRLRISWQLTGLLFSGIAALFLGKNSNLLTYQIIMAVIALLLLARTIFYNKLPELERTHPKNGDSFFKLLGKILRGHGYASFAAYIFLLMIFTANTPNIFALIEKEVIELESKTVVILANIGLIGALIGYYFGGKAIDKFSTKPLFLFSHLGYAFFSFLFLSRCFIGDLLLPLLAICHFAFGFIYATSSIAITTETIALMPKSNQALANSILTTMYVLGIGSSSLFCAGIMKLDLLKKTWIFLGAEMSNYDAILLGNGVMVVILITALGLVPSVIHTKSKYIPNY